MFGHGLGYVNAPDDGYFTTIEGYSSVFWSMKGFSSNSWGAYMLLFAQYKENILK